CEPVPAPPGPVRSARARPGRGLGFVRPPRTFLLGSAGSLFPFSLAGGRTLGGRDPRAGLPGLRRDLLRKTPERLAPVLLAGAPLGSARFQARRQVEHADRGLHL